MKKKSFLFFLVLYFVSSLILTAKSVESSKIKELNQSTSCAPPNKLSVVNISQNKATLNWTATSGISYKVEYKLNSATTWLVVNASVKGGTTTISSLLAGNTYNCRVTSKCSTSPSATINFNTLCVSPTNLSTTNLTETSATLNWTVTSGISYKVEYKLNTASTWIVANASVNGGTTTISSLLAGNTYNWQITPTCSATAVSGANFLTTSSTLDFSKAPNSYIFDITNTNNGLKIPIAKAYAMNTQLGTPIPTSSSLQAYVLWEDVPGLIRVPSTNPSYKLNFDTLFQNTQDAKILVEIDRAKDKGNAVIALYNLPNGTIPTEATPVLWSWHVWVTDDPAKQVVAGTNTLMDRNLGATSNSFLGNDWHKSGGLMYQHGRKDPFPPLKYKDESAYLVSGLIGTKKHVDFYSAADNWKRTNWPNNGSGDVIEDLKYVVKNPTTFLANLNPVNWWTGSNELLWRADKIKSAYDPCPNDYRVIIPENSAVGSRGKLFYTYLDNTVDLLNDTQNIKIYPSLGVDFTKATNPKLKKLGLMPLSGLIELQAGGITDNYAKSYLHHSAGEIIAGEIPWNIQLRSDALNRDANFGASTYGLQDIRNETTSSFSGKPVRCEKQKSSEFVNYTKKDFDTEFYNPLQENITSGINNPNSYVVMEKGVSQIIPLNKAYSMYNQYLTDHGTPPSGDRAVSVYWTDNVNLVQSISRTGTGASSDNLNYVLRAGEFGNAIVALHEGDINSSVLWSWHIWAPKIDPTVAQNHTVSGVSTPTQVTYITEDLLPIASNTKLVNPTFTSFPPLTSTFMNMNLGAENPMPAITTQPLTTEVELLAAINRSGGLHYQWGRKDPLPAPVNMRNTIFRQIGINSTNNPIYGNGIGVTENLTWIVWPNRFKYTSNYSEIFSERYDNFLAGGSNEVSGIGSSSGDGLTEAGALVPFPGAGIINTDSEFLKSQKILKYSVNKPLTFLFQKEDGCHQENCGNFNPSLDWLSTIPAIMPNRWGHAGGKSSFDPCPAGWRVPDTSIGKITNSVVNVFGWEGKGMQGNSPWYINNKRININNDGYDFNQYSSRFVGSHYPGIIIRPRLQPTWGWSFLTTGWNFNNLLYNIGTFSVSGIRGAAGGNNFNSLTSTTTEGNPNYNYQTGIWSASPGNQTGHVLALDLHGSQGGEGFQPVGMRTGSKTNPMAAMNVRCVRDVERIPSLQPTAYSLAASRSLVSVSNSEKKKNQALSPEIDKDKIVVYPNPVSEVLYLSNTAQGLQYTLHNVSIGYLVEHGVVAGNQINTSGLLPGVHILRLVNPITNQLYVNKIIKL